MKATLATCKDIFPPGAANWWITVCVQFARMRLVMSEPKPRGEQNLRDYVTLLHYGRVLKSGHALRYESAAARWDCAFESY